MELLLFGPGYGECLLVYLGAGEWLIIDSCLDRNGDQPALQHLERIGATPETDVRLVVASHWHDDHIAGLGQVVERCASAQFACAAALNRDEFLTLVQAGKSIPVQRSGVDEFARVLQVLEARSPTPAQLVTADRRLWLRAQNPLAEVWALSPSDEAVQRSLTDFASLIDEQRAPARKTVRAVSPNHASVVVWVRVGEHIALLGADLEQHSDPQLGWTAIVNSSARPLDRAHVFKVAHHGSPNGDDAAIWHQLLQPQVTACLAPFTRGRVPRPQPSDVDRLCTRADTLYQTAPAQRPAPQPLPAAVEHTVGEVAREFGGAEPAVGCVRLRAAGHWPADGWHVQLEPPAFEACGHENGEEAPRSEG